MQLSKLKFDHPYLAVISLFIIWKVVLLIISLAAYELIPLYSNHLLGGGIENYLRSYYIFPWVNFDGEHFLALAQFGYQEYTHAFFPFYPLTFTLAGNLPGNTILNLSRAGLFVSSISFLGALIFFYKLLRLDYTPRFSLGVITVLLLFPTSFYFNGLYSESIFLLLICSSFFSFRSKHFFLASILGFLACLTRAFGVLIFISFLIEILLGNASIKKAYWIFLIPFGLFSYMAYLYFTIGDPLAFHNLQLIVGEQHQRGIVLFPQIMYRYVKIIFNSEITPLYTTVLLEAAAGILFLVLPIIGYFKKIRWSYLFFAFFGYFLPTIQGSFSSLPRYVLVLFPSFIILTLMIKPLPVYLKIILGILSFLLLLAETVLFIRGYWVA